MNKRELDNIFIEAFSFLFVDYSFQIISSKKEGWGYELVAANSTTGIEIICEFRDANIQIILFRLIDGKIVRNIMSAIRNNEQITGFSLGWIIAMKNPEAQIKSAYEYETDIHDYAFLVSDKLKEYASEILNGDFSSFSVLDTMVKENYQELNKSRPNLQ